MTILPFHHTNKGDYCRWEKSECPLIMTAATDGATVPAATDGATVPSATTSAATTSAAATTSGLGRKLMKRPQTEIRMAETKKWLHTGGACSCGLFDD